MLSSLRSGKVETWADVGGSIGSNADQAYLTHSLFRYFGKLPPVLTGQILSGFAPTVDGERPPLILDLMCGSGTTLVEAQRLGYRSIGVDANPISVLVSRVKTRPLDVVAASKAHSILKEAARDANLAIGGAAEEWKRYIPEFRNRDKWFDPLVQEDLAKCRNWIEGYRGDVGTYEFLLTSWLGIIRQCSNASVRTGRIFHDRDKVPPQVAGALADRVQKNLGIFAEIPSSHFEPEVEIHLGDARTIDLAATSADFTFFHPPYFALYKYSSDVLRFELEWGGYNRKSIVAREVEDGFKTTNAGLMYTYVDDLVKTLQNAFRFTKDSGRVGIVVGNSTLSEKQLPIIEELISHSAQVGFSCERIIERSIAHSQVVYHKSANPNIRSDVDYVLLFTAG